MNVFGIDIGGSGIKGAPLDTQSGELLEERMRIKPPKPATPEAIVETAVEVLREARCEGPVGCGFPAVVKGGVVQTAANIDKAAIGFDLRAALLRELDASVSVVNDADAAGLAEMRWGAGRDQDGVVLMLTLGTGIGTSLFVGGRLICTPTPVSPGPHWPESPIEQRYRPQKSGNPAGCSATHAARYAR